MFRNIFTKLSGICSITSEFLAAKPCRCLKHRSVSPSARHPVASSGAGPTPLYRRACSIPSAGPVNSFDNIQLRGLVHQVEQVDKRNSRHQVKNDKKKHSSHLRSRDKKHRDDEQKPRKPQVKYEISDKYELESARPKKDVRYAPFNILDYVDPTEKQKDPLAHLQPSQMLPYGSTKNIYVLSTIKPKLVNIKPPNNVNVQIELNNKKNKDKKDEDLDNSREYYSISEVKYPKSTNGALKLVQKLPVGNKSGALNKTTEKSSKIPKLKSEEYTKVEQLENIVNTAKQCKEKLFQSKEPTQLSTTTTSNTNLMSTKPDFKKPPLRFRTPLGLSYSDSIKNFYRDMIMKKSIDPLMEIKEKMYAPTNTFNIIKAKSIPNFIINSKKLQQKAPTMSKKPINKQSIPYVLRKSYSSVTNVRQNINFFASCVETKQKHSNRQQRPFEPKPCEPEKEPEKCFLPSKLRLKPPPCTPKPPPCPVPEPCIRADDCLDIKIKQLPILVAKDCPCIEPHVPDVNPKLKRLKFKIKEPPRPCEIKVPRCSPRADDAVVLSPKVLKPYKPKDCPCIERPPMIDVPLKRLIPNCEPEEICYPKPDCPPPEPCIRADDCWEMPKKELLPLKPKDCPCIEPPPMRDLPRLKRLKLKVPEPPRVCPPPKICDCVERADGCLVIPPKKLPPLKPKDCPCIDRPLKDVPPLKRLVCVDEPEECYTVDPCINTPRADMGCWEYYIPPSIKKKEKKKKKPVCPSAECTKKQCYSTDINNDYAMKAKPSIPLNSKKSCTQISVQKLLERSTHQKGNNDANRNKAPQVKPKSSSVEKRANANNDNNCNCPCRAPSYTNCTSAKRSKACEKTKKPVSREKQTPPYPAFSELLQQEIKPFERINHCTKCNQNYGFTPEKNKKLCKLPDDTVKKQNKLHTHKRNINSGSSKNRKPLTRSRSDTSLRMERRNYSNCVRSSKQPFPLVHNSNQILRHKSTSDPCKNSSLPKCDKNKKPSSAKVVSPNKKPKKAPFPAFTDCLHGELSENLSEIPLDKKKIDILQPQHLNLPDLTKYKMQPIEPAVQTVDPQREEDCVRRKLGKGKRIITQDCQSFGKPIKSMRAKDHLKQPKSQDCETNEKLKKQGRWPLKHIRKYSTSFSCINLRITNSKTSLLRSSSDTNINRIKQFKELIRTVHWGCKKFQLYHFSSMGSAIESCYFLNGIYRENVSSVYGTSKHFSRYSKSQTCIAKNLKKLDGLKTKQTETGRILQPKYPIVPENCSGSVATYKDLSNVDMSLSDVYQQKKLGVKKKGVTLNCESFGFNKSEEAFINSQNNLKNESCDDPCKPEPSPCNIEDNPCNLQSPPCKLTDMPCKPKRQRKSVCTTELPSNEKCTPCKPKRKYLGSISELCDKIMKFFSPKPNCPAPDEWRKKRLRARAEKAAKAAGLAVCDPKDLPSQTEKPELPHVITPQSNDENPKQKKSSLNKSDMRCSGFDVFNLSSKLLLEYNSISQLERKKLHLIQSIFGNNNSVRSFFKLKSLYVRSNQKRFYSKSSNYQSDNTSSKEEDNNQLQNDIMDDEHEPMKLSSGINNIDISEDIEEAICIVSELKKQSLYEVISDYSDEEEELDQNQQELQEICWRTPAIPDLTFEEQELVKTNNMIHTLDSILSDMKQNKS